MCIYVYIHIYVCMHLCAYINMHVCVTYACGGQRTAYRSWFSPSTNSSVLEIEFRFNGNHIDSLSHLVNPWVSILLAS